MEIWNKNFSSSGTMLRLSWHRVKKKKAQIQGEKHTIIMLSFEICITHSFSIFLTKKMDQASQQNSLTELQQDNLRNTPLNFFSLLFIVIVVVFSAWGQGENFSPPWWVGQYSGQVSLRACPGLSPLSKLLATAGNWILSKCAWSDPAWPFQDYVLSSLAIPRLCSAL